MLALERRINQSVDLFLPSGETITVKVYHIGTEKVRLAFEAPRNVVIMRSEVPRDDRKAGVR